MLVKVNGFCIPNLKATDVDVMDINNVPAITDAGQVHPTTHVQLL